MLPTLSRHLKSLNDVTLYTLLDAVKSDIEHIITFT
jgi:hypothetical protein